MARKKGSQSKHDAEVRRIAKSEEKKGYEVEADIKGYPKPKAINRRRPDVIARKGHKRKIYEVETPDSKGTRRDLEQQKVFKKVAKRSKNTTFTRKIAK